ncbi:MAG: hypothetical protein K0R85_601 [Devosia sp.]|nr:hypothetical protein [Devosia sp.]
MGAEAPATLLHSRERRGSGRDTELRVSAYAKKRRQAQVGPASALILLSRLLVLDAGGGGNFGSKVGLDLFDAFAQGVADELG